MATLTQQLIPKLFETILTKAGIVPKSGGAPFEYPEAKGVFRVIRKKAG